MALTATVRLQTEKAAFDCMSLTSPSPAKYKTTLNLNQKIDTNKVDSNRKERKFC